MATTKQHAQQTPTDIAWRLTTYVGPIDPQGFQGRDGSWRAVVPLLGFTAATQAGVVVALGVLLPDP